MLAALGGMTMGAETHASAPQLSPNNKTEKNMNSPQTNTSFAAPVIATAFVHQGVTYQQDSSSNSEGKEIGAVYLAALNAGTGERLWLVKIEMAKKAGPLLPFDFYVHLTNIGAGTHEHEIIVSTNTGRFYSVNTQTHLVKLLNAEQHQPPQIPSSAASPPSANLARNFHVPLISLQHNGVIYQQATVTDIPTGAPPSAYLLARDANSGDMLWILPIAPQEGTETIEFFNITLGPTVGSTSPSELRILATGGKQYAVNLQEMSVRPVLHDDATEDWNPFEPPLADLPPRVN